MSGELVRKLSMATATTGGNRATWDGASEAGNPVPAGTYLYVVESEGITEAGKVTITR